VCPGRCTTRSPPQNGSSWPSANGTSIAVREKDRLEAVRLQTQLAHQPPDPPGLAEQPCIDQHRLVAVDQHMAADQEALDRVMAIRHEWNVGKQIAAPAQSLVEMNQLLRAARAPKPRGMDAGKTEVRIVADDRENAGGVIAALRELPGVDVEVRRLPCGDFLVGDQFTVERKTLRDFASSIIDGRVFRQASAIGRNPRRGVLVLEGSSADLHSVGVQREALQGALICVSVFLGMSVLRAHDPAETARLIVYLGRQAKAYAHGSHPRPGYRPKGRRARQLFLLQGLPRVGPERAARLLDHFGSVQAVATASAVDLATIDGIGESIAARIRWALGAADTADNPEKSEWSS